MERIRRQDRHVKPGKHKTDKTSRMVKKEETGKMLKRLLQ